MSEPTPDKVTPDKATPISVEQLKANLDKAKGQQVSPWMKDWLKNRSVADPLLHPEVLERARKLGIQLPED